MITDFRISIKTSRPAVCHFWCCGNKFGRIERSYHANVRGVNRIKKARRYAKRAERIIVQRMITDELNEMNHYDSEEYAWDYGYWEV